MEITLYGGAQEVGKSCIELGRKVLLDAGLKITPDGVDYPLISECSHIMGVFLSHGHLDHCGALPLLVKRGLSAKVFCTNMTRETAKILLKDSFNIEIIQNQSRAYGKHDLKDAIGLLQGVSYEKKYGLGDISFSFHYAGHIPGAASILVSMDGKRILYTGDFNTLDSYLVKGASYAFKDIDVLITEATYGDREHPERALEEQRFLAAVEKTILKGGNVLIPVFAIGRAQEIIEILLKRQFNVPVYLDGMAKKVTDLYLKRPEFVTGTGDLKKAASVVNYVRKSRHSLVRNQCIVVTTSGMLDGGPVLDYLGHFYNDPKNAVLLTGYQPEGCNGRRLLETREVEADGRTLFVKAYVDKFDFSAHAGKKQILDVIRQVKPKIVLLQHGDPEAIKGLTFDASKICNVCAPKIGETIKV